MANKKQVAKKMYVTKKTFDGKKLTFMSKNHPERIKHEAHEKLLASRKEAYNKFIFGK